MHASFGDEGNVFESFTDLMVARSARNRFGELNAIVAQLSESPNGCQSGYGQACYWSYGSYFVANPQPHFESDAANARQPDLFEISKCKQSPSGL